MRIILALLTVVLIAGCGKTGGGGDKPLPPPAVCNAILTWEAPTERTDGTPLTVKELKNYTIYVSDRNSVEDQYIQQVIDVNPNMITYAVKDLGPGQHWFYMTVTTLDNFTSTQSNSLGIDCSR